MEKKAREGDALATAKANLQIGVYSADCVPILVAAVQGHQPIGIMAIHAGWRGTAQQIVLSSCKEFFNKLQAPDVNFFAAIGPCISYESFEVGAEVFQAFPNAERDGLAKFLREVDGQKKYLVDLPRENARQLQEAGKSLPLQVEILGHCTWKEHDRYPSFRRDKEKAGRILSFLKIQSP